MCCNLSTKEDTPSSLHKELNELQNTFNLSPISLLLITSNLERLAIVEGR